MASKLILKELSRYKTGTCADIICRNALFYPDSEAFVYNTKRVTFAEFNTRVNGLIHALWSSGVKQGDVIGMVTSNCLGYADVFGAAQKGGFISSPFNPLLHIDELEYLINYSEAKILFIGPEYAEKVCSIRERIPEVKTFVSFDESVSGMLYHDDMVTKYSAEEPDVQVEEDFPLFIVYTSGTTGLPHGALYTHRAAIDDVRTFVIAKALKEGVKHITIMPLFHVGGIESILGTFYIGGTSVIMKSFDPVATLEAIQKEKATDIQMVPTHLAAIFSLPDFNKYDVSSLKRIYYVGSPMPVQLLKKGLDTWGLIFMQGYGQTESGPNLTILSNEDHDVLRKSVEEQKVLLSCGRPSIGVQMRVVNDDGRDVEPGEKGEIIAKSKHNMCKYWRKPDDTRHTIIDGWLHTGDIGYYDEKGYIYIADRKKDMIISGGENIYPREVEEVLYQHPSVREAAIIGIPDPYWVEKVHAVIALKPGENVTAEEIVNFCKSKIARYKAPKSVEFVDALPKNASGKILKREIREKYLENIG